MHWVTSIVKIHSLISASMAMFLRIQFRQMFSLQKSCWIPVSFSWSCYPSENNESLPFWRSLIVQTRIVVIFQVMIMLHWLFLMFKSWISKHEPIKKLLHEQSEVEKYSWQLKHKNQFLKLSTFLIISVENPRSGKLPFQAHLSTQNYKWLQDCNSKYGQSNMKQ